MMVKTGSPLIYSLAVSIFCTFLVDIISTPCKAYEGKQIAFESSQKDNDLVKDFYILGPGDAISVDFLDLPELNFKTSIGPDGYIYAPRLRQVKAEGYTLNDFTTLLSNRYSEYIKFPELFIRVTKYRPVKILISGEINDGGFYQLNQNIISENNTFNSYSTLFDAIKKAGGITASSDLKNIEIYRKYSINGKIGRIKTRLDLTKLIYEGKDNEENIRIVDGDSILIPKNKNAIKDLLVKSTSIGMNSKEIRVFVSGRVIEPKMLTISRGSSLNQAIAIVGGPKAIRGNVEHFRINPDGEIVQNTFKYEPEVKVNNITNPILESGDIIRIKQNKINIATGILDEVTSPFIGIYSLLNIFN